MGELITGVGNFPALNAAIKAGANAVYFGVQGFNMRAFAANFEESQLPKIAKLCHENNMKAYLTVNSIVYENELTALEKLLKNAKEAGIDAIICWDHSVIKKAKAIGLEIHLSTQASVSNSEAAEFYENLGVKRIVLARELTLEQIKEIIRKIKERNSKLEIECFIHGAMCISVSGRCFLSHELFGKSANRGECVQPCRREYKAVLLEKDNEEDNTVREVGIGKGFLFSPKDLCVLPFLDKLVEAGIHSFKIEGRSKTSDYAYTVTKVYRQALTAIDKENFSEELIEKLDKELRTVYNRDFSPGNYFGVLGRIGFVEKTGSLASKRRIHIGEVKNYFQNINVAEIKLISDIKKGDEILIEGKTTFLLQNADSMQVENKKTDKASKGQSVGLKVNERVRPKDKVFILKNI